MKKRYMPVIVAICLFVIAGGIGAYWLFDTKASTPAVGEPQNQNSQTGDAEHQAESDTDENVEEDNQAQEGATETDEDDPDTLKDQLTSILSNSLQKAVDIFVDQETYVTAVGDSLTQGVGDQYDAGGYVGILDRTINDREDSDRTVTFDNFGKRGNRSDQLLKRLEKEEIQDSIEQADVVLITIGANDVMKVVKQNITNLTFDPFEKEREKYRKRLNKILEKVHTLNDNADIYLLGFYNPFEAYFGNVEEFDTILSEWNKTSRDVTTDIDHTSFIPIADLFRDADEDLFAADNFHPNYYGYERMADRVIEYISQER